MERKPQNQTFCKQTLGDDGKEKLPFNQKKHPAEPDTGRRHHLLRLGGGVIDKVFHYTKTWGYFRPTIYR